MKSVTNNSLLITIISFLKVTNSVQLFPLVGVPNDLFDRYSQETFTCLDGSKTISKWDINDDYCDCPDGSDEPGTAACDFTFFCENRGYKSGKILSSRVNDGICDPECCDGSDEYDGKILCKDVCEEVAKNETKALKEKQKVVDQGLKVKNKYISHFKTWKVETESKIKEIQAKFDELEKKANELKTIKEEKEKLEEVLNKQDEDARQKNRINELDDKVTALEGIIEEQKKNIDHLLDVLKDLKEHHNQNYHDMAVKGAITSYDEFSGSYKPVDIWTDPRVNPTTTTDSSSQATASGDDSEASKIRQGSYFSNFIKGQINSVQKFIDRVFSSQFPIDASSARSDYWNLDSERNDAKRELDDLNTKLNRDMGPDGEYSALSDKCFELDNGEYVYSVCMFGEANQKSNKNYDSVSLGHFSEWVGTDYSAQLYSNGTPCWNGPSRSVKLNLICGTEEKVTSVTEPSKCEYHISMLTPAACKPLGVSKPDVYDEDSEL